jgi:hypothetical protein
MSPADKAQIETAKFNAEMSKREAGNIMTSATESIGQFTEEAQKQLGQGVAILGKTGNLGNVKNTTPTSGIDVGASETSEVTALRTRKSELEKQLTGLSKTVTTHTGDTENESITSANPEYTKTQKELKTLTEQLGTVGSGAADIKTPEALLYASGSDLLSMVTTRDSMERDKRTLLRNAQTDAMTALKSGENYEKQAKTLSSASPWNTFSSILGTGMGALGFGKKMEWF